MAVFNKIFYNVMGKPTTPARLVKNELADKSVAPTHRLTRMKHFQCQIVPNEMRFSSVNDDLHTTIKNQ
ncbi:hypothetical protein SOMG_01456 [Schizosaccharomyces osmophilus]|uniref:Uncharacterized protein n=1 Tax=Schizosaccharomyces osmophilus TaxID=2545709 RepID=A0AAE9WD08_9SCHI|nr:uncharacterized protein SOMG_01456 [Schizosaccharomyces osmophilus]WBW72428.1 hypothetical protein SOMG_01456 [Schizosaccharomyces osmophilus]